MTSLFHIDHVLMSHESTCVVTDHIKLLDNDPLTVTRGNMHEYLGIILDFRQKGSVACKEAFDESAK